MPAAYPPLNFSNGKAAFTADRSCLSGMPVRLPAQTLWSAPLAL